MKLTRLLTLASLFAAPAAFAHVGHMHGEHHSFMEGFIHPLTGLDHLVMLLGLGMLMNRARVNDNNAKGKIMLAVAALVTLTLGLTAGSMIGFISGVELMIAASAFVVALGIWNAFTSRESMTQFLVFASIGLVFFHGYAHGVEASGSLVGFGAGMLVAASAIMFVGERVSQLLATKWLGAGIAASGVALMLAS